MCSWVWHAERGEKEIMSTTDMHTNKAAKIDAQLWLSMENSKIQVAEWRYLCVCVCVRVCVCVCVCKHVLSDTNIKFVDFF